MEIMKGIKPQQGGCSCCGYVQIHLPLNSVIAVGFGSACLTKNGMEVWSEERMGLKENLMTVEDAEKMARKEPDADWRIHLVGPLKETHFQRQKPSIWVLYEQGDGFA